MGQEVKSLRSIQVNLLEDGSFNFAATDGDDLTNLYMLESVIKMIKTKIGLQIQKQIKDMKPNIVLPNKNLVTPGGKK